MMPTECVSKLKNGVKGQEELAVKYYREAAKEGYEKAKERIRGMRR